MLSGFFVLFCFVQQPGAEHKRRICAHVQADSQLEGNKNLQKSNRYGKKVPLCVPYSVLFPKHLPWLRIGCTNWVACSYSLCLVGDKKEFTSVYTKGKNPFGFPAWFQAACQAGIRRTGVLPASHRCEHPERQRCSVHTSWCDALSSPLRRHLRAAGCPSLSPGCRGSCILIPHSQAIEILGMS